MQHTVSIYQKPRQGNGFLFRTSAYRYKHKISAMGGFDTASCELALTQAQAETALEQWVGNRIAVYADNPVEPIWEGLISRITVPAGIVQNTISLDDMANRIRVNYVSRGVGFQTQITTAVNDTASQAIYGIKEDTLDGGSTANTAGAAGYFTDIGNAQLALRAYPRVSTSVRTSGARAGLVQIECIGFFHTLEWENNAQGAPAGTRVPYNAASGVIDTLLALLANGSTFFSLTRTDQLTVNTAVDVPLDGATGKSWWMQIQQMCDAGNGTAPYVRYITGITPTDPNFGTRALYYKAASTTIGYTIRVRDGTGYIRNTLGAVVKPYWVRPDTGVRLNDILVGWAGNTLDDPREFYLSKVDYDADTQSVSLSSDDDISVEGAFQLGKITKAYGKRFGAALRGNG